MTFKEKLKIILSDLSQPKEIETQFAEVSLLDGTVLVAESFEPGQEVKVKETGELAPDGEHELSDNKILVISEGKIVEIKEKEEIEVIVEEPVTELVEQFSLSKEEFESIITTLQLFKSEIETLKLKVQELNQTPSTDSVEEKFNKINTTKIVDEKQLRTERFINLKNLMSI